MSQNSRPAALSIGDSGGELVYPTQGSIGFLIQKRKLNGASSGQDLEAEGCLSAGSGDSHHSYVQHLAGLAVHGSYQNGGGPVLQDGLHRFGGGGRLRAGDGT